MSIEDIETEIKVAASENRRPKPLIVNSPKTLRACMLENVLPFQLKPISFQSLRSK